MKFKFLKLILIVTFLFANAFATLSVINETMDITDVQKNINSGTLVVFDFDHVIACNANPIGGEAWFGKMLGLIMAQGFSFDAAKSKLIPVYDNLQMTADVQLVDPRVKGIIKDLQDAGIPVIIITIRSVGLIDRTLEQLASIGIDMSRTMLPANKVNQLDESKLVYKRGVLCCDGMDKGLAFDLLVGNNFDFIKEIRYIDDSVRHVKAMQNMAAKKAINFVGLRYGVMDAFVKNYVLTDELSISWAEKIIQELFAGKSVLPVRMQLS